MASRVARLSPATRLQFATGSPPPFARKLAQSADVTCSSIAILHSRSVWSAKEKPFQSVG